MANPAVQLSFTLRTSPNVRTVHLLGSWDNYKNQLPLSSLVPTKDNPSVKPGSWRGTFRFQGSHALKLGSRYWYYYIVDGYHVSHDPAKEFVTEPTTGRMLNVLDVPGVPTGAGERTSTKPGATAQGGAVRYSTSSVASTTSSGRHSRQLPQGRALSPGKILHPKPSKPYASRQIREADYERSPVEGVDDLVNELDRVDLGGYGGRHILASGSSNSPSSSLSGSSGSYSAEDGDYGSSLRGSSSPSSFSSVSSGSCRCERFGITRGGERIKLDCGGARCGYVSSSQGSGSECSSEQSSDSEREARVVRAKKEMERISARELDRERDRHGSSHRREPEKEKERPVAKEREKARSRHSVAVTADRRGTAASHSSGGRKR